MASTRARGRNLELKCKRLYESKGYQVQIAPMPSRWSFQNDLFGLWDLIAVNKDEIICIQCKMNRNDIYGKQLDAHRAWVCPAYVKKLAILWEPRKHEPEIIVL